MRQTALLILLVCGCPSGDAKLAPLDPTPKDTRLHCDGLLTNIDLERVCGIDTDPFIHGRTAKDMVCNRVFEGASPLQNLRLTIEDHSIRKPYLLHAMGSKDVEHFKKLTDVGRAGTRWTRHQPDAGTYTLNVEFVTPRWRAQLSSQTWTPGDPEKTGPTCTYPQMVELARIVDRRLP